ncbi:MAG TPA: fasciclin domain-containing protein [Streptosporangiaceae bacterium]|nr:fasciclin domain-containing protein [Streptosporangiaceae bacterium]
MAPAPVVTVLQGNPLLTTIARAIKAAGLTSRLNAAKAITVFAPDDPAFMALGRGNLTTLLASKSDLAKVVQFHVVKGRLTPADLASGRHLTTLLGTVIVPAKLHGRYRVNNAQVVCGNIRTANATVYIVNKVLVPIP